MIYGYICNVCGYTLHVTRKKDAHGLKEAHRLVDMMGARHCNNLHLRWADKPGGAVTAVHSLGKR